MRNGFLAAIAALLAWTGWVLAQTAPPAPAAPNAAPAPATLEPNQAPESPALSPLSAPALAVPDYGPGVGWHGPCCLPPAEGDAGPRFWVSADFLLWWFKDYPVPPLVTTGPATFPVAFLGNLGTALVFGDERLQGDPFAGARVSVGVWLNDCNSRALEGNAFFLGPRSQNANFGGIGLPVLARPFINQNTGTEFSEFAGFPGISTGSIGISNPSQLWGWEANLKQNLSKGCSCCVDLLAGARYLDLQEELTITEEAVFSPTAPFPALAGNEFVATDRFATRNQFYGGQVGANVSTAQGPWRLAVSAKAALGATHEVVDIQGNQQVITTTGTRVFTGGLLALPSNIGRVNRDQFAVVPDFAVNLGLQITPHIQVYVGYTFLYWSSVVRPGDQIDRVLDVNQIPNFGVAAPPVRVSRPLNPFNEADFWAQGVNVGVAVGW
jgi:hypothetical protein